MDEIQQKNDLTRESQDQCACCKKWGWKEEVGKYSRKGHEKSEVIHFCDHCLTYFDLRFYDEALDGSEWAALKDVISNPLKPDEASSPIVLRLTDAELNYLYLAIADRVDWCRSSETRVAPGDDAKLATEADALDRIAFSLPERTGRVERAGARPLQVTVTVEGGVVQDVDVPAGVQVVVQDYDIEGVDEDRIKKSDSGQDCALALYGPGGELPLDLIQE